MGRWGTGEGGGGGENAAVGEEVVGGARVGVGGEEVEVGGGVEEGVTVDGDAVGSGRLREVVGKGDPWAPAPCRALWEYLYHLKRLLLDPIRLSLYDLVKE